MTEDDATPQAIMVAYVRTPSGKYVPLTADENGKLPISLQGATVEIGEVALLDGAGSPVLKGQTHKAGALPVVLPDDQTLEVSNSDIATMQDDIALIKADISAIRVILGS